MGDDFYHLMEQVKVEAEKALSKLSIFERAVLWMFMPLGINVTTDKGAASLVVLRDGTIQLGKNPLPNPDNTIHADFEVLSRLYQIRDRNQFLQVEKAGKIRVTSQSSKGEQAEGKLRELLGS